MRGGDRVEDEGVMMDENDASTNAGAAKSLSKLSIDEEEENGNGDRATQQQPDREEENGNGDSTSVRVAVRIRPLLALESDTDDCVRVLTDKSAVSDGASGRVVANGLQLGGSSGPRFTFDEVFSTKSSQRDVYEAQVSKLVDSCLEGYNATILAYGQTGSGKTYTILGEDTRHCSEGQMDDENGAGVLPRAIRAIFHRLNRTRHEQQLREGGRTGNKRKRQRPVASSGRSSASTTSSGGEDEGADSGSDPAASDDNGVDEGATTDEDDDDDDMDGNFSFQVKIQFLEIYGDEIRDLLATHAMATTNTGSPTKLTIRDTTALTDEPEVVGATQMRVESAQDALEALQKGMVRRVTGATAMNQTSSRSHAILSVMMEQRQRQVASAVECGSGSGAAGDESSSPPTSMVQVKRSKFNFVDLAGSERLKRTHAEGQRLREGININQGLLVLGNVISALGDPQKKGSFVPYRDSKLTRLLKGSLGGNHKTLMIACVSPSSNNMVESLNCLRYANRAKNIQNRAVVNVDENSRLLSQLRGQVQTLAGELLRAWDDETNSYLPPPTGPLTREKVEALVAGKKTSNNNANAAAAASFQFQLQPHASPDHHRHRVTTPSSAEEDAAAAATAAAPNDIARHRELEIELGRARDQLRELQANHDAAEEQLYASKAENQLYQLQLSVLSPTAPGEGSVPPVGSTGGNAGVAQEVFLDRVTRYEAEIGRLKQALRDAEAKSNNHMAWMDGGLHEDKSIEKAKRALERDREKLAQIQSNLTSDGETPAGGELESLQHSGDSDDVDAASSGSLDQREQAEQAELNVLTKKYLGADHDSDEVETHDGDDERSHNAETPGDGDIGSTCSSPTPNKRHRHLQADLVELARNIAAKEDLIDQLRLSQEKYASMRDFYEEKLRQMETTLNEKESEREQLLGQLRRSKETDEGKKLLQDRLKEKEAHIASLRKKQKELSELTMVSSRHHADIARLQTEVKTMKRRKVDLQKLLGQERKHHASEKRELEKTALQKDREVNKWKRVSTQREVQAEKACQVAKARLEEIGLLRSKYREAEKKLRLLSLKKGVMAKAGLDPVLIGRREGKRGSREKLLSSSNQANADSVRDFFDQKVAEVVRKEAIADKLAQEWEEHFELSTKKEELIENGGEGYEEEAQSLELQLRFKEDKIRQLAQRLGKQRETTKASSSKTELFLFDEEFKRFCSGLPAESSKVIAAKVLFGMVVRERRRITALARTASALDERAQAAEKAAEANEEALRSYMNEQRRELEALTQAQHEQILSLMDLVKDTSEDEAPKETTESTDKPEAKESHDLKLLALANERISLLESQIDGLYKEAQTADSYREQIDELNALVKGKSKESEDFQEDISGLRAVLRQIRELVTGSGHGDNDTEHVKAAVLEIINDSLHPSPSPGKKPKRRTPSSSKSRSNRRSLTPRVKKHVELMHTSDSGEDGDAPAWAADIMADLALIAKGEMPPSLEPVLQNSMDTELNTDWENSQRLQKRLNNDNDPSPQPPSKAERRAMSKDIAARLDKIVIPGSEGRGTKQRLATTPAAAEVDHDDEQKHRKSVFDRLVSPSQYTGTQKERHQTKHGKKNRGPPKDAAAKLLDDLLQSDNEAFAPAKPSTGDRTGSSSSKMSDYTQLDVFERLQRTTTQAYAVKHVPETNRSDDRDHAHVSPSAPTPVNRTSANTAMRDSSEQGEKASAASVPTSTHSVPDRSMRAGYTSQDVFERLQKTTTEAYAKKTTRHDHKP